MKKLNNRNILLSILLFFSLFLLLGYIASGGVLDQFNLAVTQTMQQWNNEAIILLMQFVSILEFLAPLILLILVILFHLRKMFAEILFLILSTGYLIPKIVKEIYRLGCPTEPQIHKWWILHLPYQGPLEILKTNYCFPSGHVFSYVVFGGFLLYLTVKFIKNRRAKRLISASLLSIIVLIGPSRIYLGAHWTMDVVGGYLLGLSYLLIIILIYGDRQTIAKKCKAQSAKIRAKLKV